MEVLSSFELCSTMPTYPGRRACWLFQAIAYQRADWCQSCRSSNVQKKYFQREKKNDENFWKEERDSDILMYPLSSALAVSDQILLLHISYSFFML